MVVKQLTAKQAKIKDFILLKNSLPAVAKLLKMNLSAVRRTAHQLEALGHIRRIPGEVNPILYYDPKTLPLGSEYEKTVGIAGSDGKKQAGDGFPRSPEDSRVHLNGEIYYRIRNIGDMETIRDNSGLTVGGWTKIAKPKGRIDNFGLVRFGDKDITFVFRKGNKGKVSFAVWPNDIYLSGEDAMRRGEMILKDRADRVTELLRNYGWRFYDREVHGTFESGHPNNPMAARMDRKHVNSEATVKLDTSPGIPEIEVTESEANDILSFAPEHIVQLYAEINKLIKENRQLRVEVLESENFMLERQATAYEIMRRQIATEDTMRPARRRETYADGDHADGGMYQ